MKYPELIDSKYDDIETGDLLLASYDNLTGYIIRFLTNSNFHHVCVAIRIDESKLPEIHILKNNGSLYILDNWYFETESKVYQFVLMPLKFSNYNHYIYRKVKSSLKNPDYYSRIIDYISSNTYHYIDRNNFKREISKFVKTKNSNIPCSTRVNKLPFQNISKKYCSEITYSFYDYVIPNKLKNIRSVYIPEHFLDPEFESIFDKQKTLIYEPNVIMNTVNNNILYAMILILIFVIFLLILFKYKKQV